MHRNKFLSSLIYSSLKFNNLLLVILMALTLLLGVHMYFSFEWNINHDIAMNYYEAFLMDKFGYVPYKDFFDTSMPGTHIFYWILVKIFGYSDLWFRITDMLLLGVISSFTYLILKQFDPRIAWCAIVLFGTSYLIRGIPLSLQRDYIALIPTVIALYFFQKNLPSSLYKTSFLIGGLFGIAALIKPQFILGMAILIPLLALNHPDLSALQIHLRIKKLFTVIIVSAFGLSTPILCVFFWLYQEGGLDSFLFWSLNYYPLYNQMSGEYYQLEGFGRILYRYYTFSRLGNLTIWLVPATISVYTCLFIIKLKKQAKILLYAFIGLLMSSGLSVIIAGKFFSYHWIPFSYFIIVLASLSLTPILKENRVNGNNTFPAIILGIAILLAVQLPPDFFEQIRGRPIHQYNMERINELTNILNNNLHPGETVQALDFVIGGAIPAMLRAGARTATPFLGDMYFYHHVNSPQIQTIRNRFITELRQEKPA
jgi:hypothetical protein